MRDNAGHGVPLFKLDTVFTLNLPSALKGPGCEQTTYSVHKMAVKKKKEKRKRTKKKLKKRQKKRKSLVSSTRCLQEVIDYFSY